MHWLKVRMAPLGVLAVLACSGDPTDNQGTPTEITAVPDVVFVTQGDSEAVIVSVVDEQGQIIEADFTSSDVGAGITAVEDPTFQELNNTQQIRRQARFFVKASDLTHTTFKVNALGLSKTIDVTVVPGALDAAITDTVPKLGDTVTITAPTGTFFSDTSVLTFNGVTPVITSRDATTITFIPFPNITDPVVVSFVGVDANPRLAFTLATPYNVHTDSIIDAGAGISNPTPALGDPITLTLPDSLRVLPESLVTLSIAGNPVLPINATASADSSIITFTPPPNSDSVVVVTGVVPSRLAVCCGAETGYALQLSTTAKVTTPVIDSVPSTLSSPAPAANDEVTLTITDAQFTLTDTANVVVGAVPATVVGRTANTLTFVPTPAATGGVTVNGIVRAGFALALPSTAGSMTVGALTPLGGATNQANAPELTVPGAGETTTVFDQPNFPAADDPIVSIFELGPTAFYKIVIPADGDYTITTNWDIGSDIDMFVCGSPIDDVELANCDFQAATGDQPETGTYPLTAGTHFIVVNDFGQDATGATIQITIEH